jgi:hypothetical protein
MNNLNNSNDSQPSSFDIHKVLQFLNSQVLILRTMRMAMELPPLEWNRRFLSLRFETIDLSLALCLNRIWHSHLPQLDKRVASWLCYGAKCDDRFHAAAVWSLPIARLLPQDGSCLELRRFAIAPSTPKNSASRMLGWMARDIARSLPNVHRLVSYQDCDVHKGTIYKAAGWIPASTPSGGDWNNASRRRSARRIRRKVRWELVL